MFCWLIYHLLPKYYLLITSHWYAGWIVSGRAPNLKICINGYMYIGAGFCLLFSDFPESCWPCILQKFHIMVCQTLSNNFAIQRLTARDLPSKAFVQRCLMYTCITSQMTLTKPILAGIEYLVFLKALPKSVTKDSLYSLCLENKVLIAKCLQRFGWTKQSSTKKRLVL